MKEFDFLNNYADSVCVFSLKNEIVFTNNIFKVTFPVFRSISKFKNSFNFNLCALSTDNINITPIDLLLESDENFHTIASYQKADGNILYFYIYSFKLQDYKIVIFKDVSSDTFLEIINKRYDDLKVKYIDIHSFLGSFKTYFSVKEKNGFRIKYNNINNNEPLSFCEYENDVIESIKKKQIVVTPCLKECINADEFFNNGVIRVIVPVYTKNKLLGIIVTFTKQKVSLEDNYEILQSIAVQLSSSIIQTGLILQLNKKNKKLEKTLFELKETQLQLINSEKMASLGQLISGVAHEINTPLASINSNNSLIKKVLSSSSLSEQKINMIKELNSIDIAATERISDIVKSLKRFVRLDEAQFQDADINSEIDLTLKLMQYETKNKINIVKNYSQLPPVFCSVNMLNQVFMNIIMNACQNIKEFKKTGEIIISTYLKDNNLIVSIKDNGNGIPLDIQPRIFNTGFTTKKAGAGMGLGLAISKKIVEMHKGSITFTSQEGIGSEFIVSIPLHK